MYFLKSKMLLKGLFSGIVSGSATAGATMGLPAEVDTSEKAVLTAIVTIGTALWTMYNNWRKNH